MLSDNLPTDPKLRRQMVDAFESVPVRQKCLEATSLPIVSVETYLTNLAPDLFSNRPAPPRPYLLTRNNNFKRTKKSHPWPAIEVYRKRLAAGFHWKHPDDVYLEDQPAFAAIGKHLENGSTARGRMIFIGCREAGTVKKNLDLQAELVWIRDFRASLSKGGIN